MNKLVLFFSLISLVFGLVFAKVALDNFMKAAQYEELYETERNELESVYRTVGRGADPAYTCKQRTKQ